MDNTPHNINLMESKILLAIGLTILTAATGFYYNGISTAGVIGLE